MEEQLLFQTTKSSYLTLRWAALSDLDVKEIQDLCVLKNEKEVRKQTVCGQLVSSGGDRVEAGCEWADHKDHPPTKVGGIKIYLSSIENKSSKKRHGF